MDDAGVVRALWGAVKGIFLIVWYVAQYIYHGIRWLMGKKRVLFPSAFKLPYETRFEHMLVVGGSGWGKTQLLQQFIAADIPEVMAGKRSAIVIDSQGDMIKKILRLEYVQADRVVYIDPTDTKYPPCLNLFDIGLDRVKQYSEVEQEKLINGAIELYSYMFGALLGAEMTNRQDVIFTYLARLLMVIPNATIFTLLDILEEPELVRPHISKLDFGGQRFFNTEYFSSKYDSTRQQIASRLWGVLSKPALARMFTHTQNKVDIFSAMNRGSLILINTAKDLLKQDGTAIFGRFMISLISQATQERAAVDERRRMPTFVYIDEAQDYFEQAEGLTQLISQGRKYRVGLTLATQNLGNFDHRLLKTTLASTKTKFAGGVSDDDARKLSQEMGIELEFLKGLKKNKGYTEFACQNYALNPSIGKVRVILGEVEQAPRMPQEQYASLIAHNRERYCAPIDHSLMAGSAAMASSGVKFDLEEPQPGI